MLRLNSQMSATNRRHVSSFTRIYFKYIKTLHESNTFTEQVTIYSEISTRFIHNYLSSLFSDQITGERYYMQNFLYKSDLIFELQTISATG